ncbi:MAG: hypothetical protein ACOC0M_01510 [Halomonas sp.]
MADPRHPHRLLLRPALVRGALRILVIDGGESHKPGDHEKLMTTHNRYARPFRLQASGNA